MTGSGENSRVRFTVGLRRMAAALAVLLAGCAIALALAPGSSPALSKRPNVVLIMTDDQRFDQMASRYASLLTGLLSRRALVAGIGLGVAAIGVLFFSLVKKELTPVEDRGFLVSVISAPQGSSIDYTARYALRL